LYAKNNQKENAIKLYNELIALNPNNLLLKYQLANLFYHTKQYKKSLLLFTELSKIDGKNSNFIYKLASIYRNLKKPDTAISLYKKVFQLDSLNGNSYYFIAKLYRKQKQIDSTTKYLKKGLSHNRKHILLNQLQTKVAFKAKDYQKVIQTVLLLDSLKKSSPFYINLKGIAYYRNKEFKKALKTFNSLILNKKVQDNTFYYMALSYKEMKDYANAEQFLNMAITYKRPSIAQEYYQIALLYKEQNKPQKAIAFLKKSLQEKYQNPDVLYETALLTNAYYKDKTIALKYYEDFISYYEAYYPKRTAYALQQIQKIKTDLFLQKK
jgi:tetratricopeptide (TPR) repeat protein